MASLKQAFSDACYALADNADTAEALSVPYGVRSGRRG